MMKRALRDAIAALCLAAGAFGAQAYEGFAIRDLDLRAGPSSEYPVVATISAGTWLDVQGCLADYSWCDVIALGERGWAYAAYIEYFYGSAPVPLIDYGPVIGITVIPFVLDDYWDRFYRGRPWYPDRDRWLHRPIPPHPHPPPPPPGPVRPKPAPLPPPAGRPPGWVPPPRPVQPSPPRDGGATVRPAPAMPKPSPPSTSQPAIPPPAVSPPAVSPPAVSPPAISPARPAPPPRVTPPAQTVPAPPAHTPPVQRTPPAQRIPPAREAPDAAPPPKSQQPGRPPVSQ